MNNTLYHDALLAKAKSGFGKGRLLDPDASAQLDNAFCGDRVIIDLRFSNSQITKIGYEVKGCILCEAATVTIAEILPGRSISEARELRNVVAHMMKEGIAPTEPALDIFTPVMTVRSRHDCVMLPFDTLIKAMAIR